ncbi:MAG: ABC transporter permease [Candidatus Competibacterales bacterium]
MARAEVSTAAPVAEDTIAPPRPWRDSLGMFFANATAAVGLVLLLAITALAVVGPWFYPVAPFELAWAPLSPPGQAGFLLGTDYLGRDLLAGVIHGGRATLAVGLAAASLSVVIGIGVGALAGFYRGWVEEILMRFTELFQVLPTLLFAMVIVGLFGASLPMVAGAIGIVSWPVVARLTRGEFLRLSQVDYVGAARAAGATNAWLITRVILPNALPTLVVQGALIVGVAILFEAGLSFLGLGDPNVMSWGLMIGSNRQYLLEAWWPVTFPGLMVFLTVLSISLVGDGLNDALNPRLRSR